jgi:UDP-2-acetamido-3-amino-2,3-dideoxy-glucuronate N-acetyltransferase
MTSKIHPTAFIHPLADVEDGVEIGPRTKIWRWTHIMSGAVIGSDCMVGQGCSISSAVKIGNNVRIQNGCHLFDGVVLEDFVFLGPGVLTTNVKFPRSHRKGKFEQTLIKRNASVGAGVVIICGVTLGEFCMCAASSCITRDVPPGVTIMGVPGVIKKSRAHQQELRDNKLTKEII